MRVAERGGIVADPHAVRGGGGRTGGRAVVEAAKWLGRGGRRPGRRLLCLGAKMGVSAPVLVTIAPVLAAA